MLHGRHLKNGSKHLILVFQSVSKKILDEIPSVLDGTADHAKIKKLHERYNWMNFCMDYKESDYLFVQDYFSDSYGWYLFDGGKAIYNELNQELEQFIKKHGYEKVIAFGSSKGGTGALVYGVLNPYITDVFSLVPQVKVSNFIDRYHATEKEAFYRGNTELEEEVDTFFFDPKNYQQEAIKNTTFHLYTGKNDMQFAELMAFKDYLQAHNVRVKMIVNSFRKSHSPLVTEHTELVYQTIRDINESRTLTSPELIRLNDDAYMI
ncbi:hypothetical protein BMT55_00860 [Listeria newyorkensis]|uniref:Uncharacterized protein n=1 Tax=Listeria newyorkensis TaxID=1497681 RepID=A0ABX4XS80_9LIST|nr:MULTISPECIES: hypothetical protein [Listeria]KGL39087.1 hypothetical protein EP56_14315 [Listeriaceae bacterium FSL A5-0209]KGL43937.1 hypothetical protein EP58_05645 [Listeria newyorkensis]KMT61808.1 hypothetical protein X559_1839 [Listeria newyorkensis]PNP94932.1 hypothetical protein BMT55_00860 [Listeria newyorkensis]RQW66306.1 hypothetical protein DUK53_11375 [Listeria sp. SHR_NRA_18]